MTNKASNYIGSVGNGQINNLLPIHVNSTHYIAPDETEWLRTGTTLYD